ncbi:hypothetical protein KW795_01290 [Candidatus Microgenomates bacterium]|nr:hypothetical protein [Candidatus Microgenomates bacterium]
MPDNQETSPKSEDLETQVPENETVKEPKVLRGATVMGAQMRNAREDVFRTSVALDQFIKDLKK